MSCNGLLHILLLIIAGAHSGIGCRNSKRIGQCDDEEIIFNSSGFKWDLENKLHGQHLVTHTVYKAVTDHVSNLNPAKPLVLSFHGWSGGGKSFVSRMIANNLFKRGEHSPYFHQFNPNYHFKNLHMTDLYKDQLQSWIYHNVSNCEHSVFIFDEMDHIPDGILDVLSPFLGHSAHVDGVDFRKTIFILLSNTGGKRITEVAFQHWRNGGKREEIKLRDTQEMLEHVAYNEESGLKNSKLVSNNLIDHYVPFLPMEKSHVRNCIIDEMKRRNMHRGENLIEEVLGELVWFPEVEQLYSTSGCKKIAHKLALVKDEL